jgi:hypothetical protein
MTSSVVGLHGASSRPAVPVARRALCSVGCEARSLAGVRSAAFPSARAWVRSPTNVGNMRKRGARRTELLLQRGRRSSRRIGLSSCSGTSPRRPRFKGAAVHHRGSVGVELVADVDRRASKGPPFITADRSAVDPVSTMHTSSSFKGAAVHHRGSASAWRSPNRVGSGFKGAAVHHGGSAAEAGRRAALRRCFKGAAVHHGGSERTTRRAGAGPRSRFKGPPFITADRITRVSRGRNREAGCRGRHGRWAMERPCHSRGTFLRTVADGQPHRRLRDQHLPSRERQDRLRMGTDGLARHAATARGLAVAGCRARCAVAAAFGLVPRVRPLRSPSLPSRQS